MSITIPRQTLPSVAPSPAKAGPIGPGAGVLMTEYPLFSILGNTVEKRMRTAYNIGMTVPWVRRAEMLIGSRVSTVDFDLDDPDDVEIDEKYPNEGAVAAYTLLTKPQMQLGVGQPLTRTQLWRLTSRHVGLCGNAFWLLDQREAYSGTPLAIAYVRPDRMSPDEDENGNLTSWHIDRRQGYEGIKVELNQVVHFMLEPPDSGHFGPGLVETALLRAQLSTALDKHLASVLSAGGRLSGFLAPKTGAAGDEFLQLERDWRGIVEQPDAAKRLQLVRAPVEFTQTTMTPQELAVVDLMKLMRDDLLAIWNVPGTLVGVSQPGGLNSGETRKYDEAALWQGPVHDRLVVFQEAISDGILELWQKRIGWVPELRIEEPEFDDDSPRYDLLGKSINSPLRNRERRELIGLDPFGDPMLDEAVWLPATMVQAYTAPPETQGEMMAAPAPTSRPQAMTQASDSAVAAAGETSEGKAQLALPVPSRVEPLRRSLLAVRENVAAHQTPRITDEVEQVLSAQRSEIAKAIRAHADHLTAKPGDTSVWWNERRWNEELTKALRGPLTGMAESVSRQVAELLPTQSVGTAPAKAKPTVTDLLEMAKATEVADTEALQITLRQTAAAMSEMAQQPIMVAPPVIPAPVVNVPAPNIVVKVDTTAFVQAIDTLRESLRPKPMRKIVDRDPKTGAIISVREVPEE